MLVSSPGNEYTFDESTLTANISTWTFNTKFKVLIKTDTPPLSANNLVLQVKVGDSSYAEPYGIPIVDAGHFMSYLSYSSGAGNNIGLQGAVAETDGLAFYYESCQATASDKIVFTLIDGRDGEKISNYSVTGKTLDKKTFKAISIDYSKFKTVE